MGRVVVTGGAGFVGGHLVRRLLRSADTEVVVLDLPGRRPAQWLEGGSAARVDYLAGDVRDAQTVARALRGAEAVYHLAARADGTHAGFETNVIGTVNVLEAAARYRVGRVVFASTYEVYGEPIDLPVDESHPLLALSCYGASKAAAEAYCRAYRREHGLDSVVLRLSEVYGPYDAAGPIPAWLSGAARGQNVEVRGDRTADFIWVGHVVDALVRAAGLEARVPTINVGSGTGVRLADAARRAVAAVGGQSHVRVLPEGIGEDGRGPRPARFVADVRRMRELLRIEPPLDPLAQLESLAAEGDGALGDVVPAGPVELAPAVGLRALSALRGVN
ncbi:MAG TPA: NAD-dependent epimerase/dehydratase family protein [Chloroflexota bacterium]|nr:NAD-dependent epimerase/dehydratase family protein [Chloroflexota bacterium]